MSENLVISENCCNFNVLKIKGLQTIIAIITEDKVTEIFCIADDFCKVFDAQMGKYTIKSNMKGSIMKISDRLLLRKRAIIETINDELKNIAQVKHSRHRSFDNFIVNTLGSLAAYCFFPKKPTIAVQRTADRQLTLF